MTLSLCWIKNFYETFELILQSLLMWRFASIINILNSVSLRFHPRLSLLISSLIIHYQYWDFCWDWLQMKFIIHIMISFGKTEDVLITCSVSLLIHHHASDNYSQTISYSTDIKAAFCHATKWIIIWQFWWRHIICLYKSYY